MMELLTRVQKAHYSFKEVTSLTGVKPYVLRFWETEFTQITPEAHTHGTKKYSKKDIEIILTIKGLLFDKKLSIQQVKAYLDGTNVSFASVENLSIEDAVTNVTVSEFELPIDVNITYEKRNQTINTAPAVVLMNDVGPVKQELLDILVKIEALEKKYYALNS